MVKKDGGLRPCIAYRALNNQTVKYRYPLSLVPTALEQLRGARKFSKLDLRKGEEWKTAFITPSGHYEYWVMSYGLANSPSISQSIMNEVFRDMLQRFVIIYIDEILIYYHNLAENYHHIAQVIQSLRDHQLPRTPDPNLPFSVEVDASSNGVGAELLRRQSE